MADLRLGGGQQLSVLSRGSAVKVGTRGLIFLDLSRSFPVSWLSHCDRFPIGRPAGPAGRLCVRLVRNSGAQQQVAVREARPASRAENWAKGQPLQRISKTQTNEKRKETDSSGEVR